MEPLSRNDLSAWIAELQKVMNMRSRLIAILLLAVTILGRDAPPTWGQKKGAPTTPADVSPQIAMPMPLGVQRGATLDMIITGTNLANPTGLSLGFPAK